MSTFSLTYPEDASAVICDVDVAQSAVARGEYVRCKALWDTGAVATVVSSRLVRALGLSAIDQNMATTVQGSYLASIYLLDVLLPNKMLVKSLRVSDGEFDDCDILIGMDLIRLGDMMITNGSAMKFTFRIPSEGDKPFEKEVAK